MDSDRQQGSFETRADHPRSVDAIATDHADLALFISATGLQVVSPRRLRTRPHQFSRLRDGPSCEGGRDGQRQPQVFFCTEQRHQSTCRSCVHRYPRWTLSALLCARAKSSFSRTSWPDPPDRPTISIDDALANPPAPTPSPSLSEAEITQMNPLAADTARINANSHLCWIVCISAS